MLRKSYSNGLSKYPIDGDHKVEGIMYDERTCRVYINQTQYFENVFKDVWTFEIGGYQEKDKYLKERKKREDPKLSLEEINHYQEMVNAIRLTVELQEKIDDVYKKLQFDYRQLQ